MHSGHISFENNGSYLPSEKGMALDDGIIDFTVKGWGEFHGVLERETAPGVWEAVFANVVLGGADRVSVLPNHRYRIKVEVATGSRSWRAY